MPKQKNKIMVLVAQKHRAESNGNHFMPRNENRIMRNLNTSEMTISIEKKIAQPSAAKLSKEEKESVDAEQLKSLFEQVLTEKNEIENCNMSWVDDKTVVLDKLSGLTLHNFLLKVEEMGKNITFTKKTVIEIH